MRKVLFAANWKMNKAISESAGFVPALMAGLGDARPGINRGFEIVIAPSYTHLAAVIESARGTGIGVSAQNCGGAKSGPFTGEISPVVLKELGCTWTLIGHSERRHVFKEDDSILLSRVRAALDERLSIVFCIGETLEERRSGRTMKVLESQLKLLTALPGDAMSTLVVAYEPVWAIGTGENATTGQAEEAHAFIREWLTKNYSAAVSASTRILYGGSVKADNSEAILSQPNVDGLLVGGASLEPATLAKVVVHGLQGKKQRLI